VPERKSPWRRAFSPLVLGAAAAFTIAGVAVLLLVRSNLGVGVGAGLCGITGIILMSAVFLAIGYGEDDERADRTP
jgi:hypothetical protein